MWGRTHSSVPRGEAERAVNNEQRAMSKIGKARCIFLACSESSGARCVNSGGLNASIYVVSNCRRSSAAV